MCLLKGCERWFTPAHPQERYCGAGCRAAAKRWRDWKSQQRYRGTSGGRERRRSQSKRYRERVAERKRPGEAPRRAPERGTRVSVQKKIFMLL